LYEELRAICSALDGAGVTYALVGGLAVSIYATPRATKDIDILLAPEDLERLGVTLRPLGYEDLAAPMTFAGGRITIRRFTKLSGTEFLALDVLLPRDPALQQILSRRQVAGGEANRLWIAPVDGLIELKRLRGSPQDLADIAALTGAES
jgi:hypothetical protein